MSPFQLQALRNILRQHKLAILVAISCFGLMTIAIILTPYFLNLYDLTVNYALYYLAFVFIFEITCLCSLMLFAFTPNGGLECDNKTTSITTLNG
ncbi:hypothetical protein MN116_007678 [Schistosoma mekongi]|uniref:Uncharacterized protein n=1 Tax=Schistosoma mekongi TaxID=38744 RepID=A0AAE2D323_SCHME|nr:hypothetical protein MN116_007678 [Schistosoma mekongi]